MHSEVFLSHGEVGGSDSNYELSVKNMIFEIRTRYLAAEMVLTVAYILKF